MEYESAAKKFSQSDDCEFWHEIARIFAESTWGAVIAIDLEEKIIAFNKQAECAFSKKKEEVIGHSLKKVFPHLAYKDYYLLHAIHHGRELKDVETDYCPYTRQRGAFLHNVRLVKNRRDNIGGAVWLRKDFTFDKRFHQEVSNAEIHAIASQIAAGTAHEIRNPLTASIGYIQLAQKKKNGADKYLEFALEELRQIDSCISSLLSLFYPNKKVLQLININYLVEELLQLVQNVGIMANVVINTDLREDIPICLAVGKLLKHALLNILRNALEAMGSGGSIMVTTSYDKVQNSVIITVKDTGVGISKAHLKQIFLPSFSTKEGSSGLGLTMAKRIIRYHNGFINVTSTLGKGTTVEIGIPVTDRQQPNENTIFHS